ncbi:MAG: hypothetical protein H7Y08_09420 [Rhizobiaceae bacterium]|nr:hypothetical protein [Rhizobiaceae bacterium]
MIATGLTFLFGALLTALLVLLVAPIVWRKAQTLARREFEATIPASANEIRAGLDGVRAQAALSIRRSEVLLAEIREKSARTQAELGRSTVENVGLLKRSRQLAEDLSQREAELAKLDELVALKEEETAKLARHLAAARQDSDTKRRELVTIEQRFRELSDIAEERRLQLVAADDKSDLLADALRLSERQTREAEAEAERLRDDAVQAGRAVGQEKTQSSTLNEKVATLLAGIADRDEEILRLKARLVETSERASVQRTQPARRDAPGRDVDADLSDVRDQISDLAARVLRMASLAEGPDSPLARLIEKPADVAGTAGGRLSLADRVRLLSEEEAAGGATPSRSQAAR